MEMIDSYRRLPSLLWPSSSPDPNEKTTTTLSKLEIQSNSSAFVRPSRPFVVWFELFQFSVLSDAVDLFCFDLNFTAPRAVIGRNLNFESNALP